MKGQEKKESISSDQLVIATGRKPNTNGLNLEKIGVKFNNDGSIQTNEHGQTSLLHIYAAGDVTGNPAFVYTAAYTCGRNKTSGGASTF